MSQNKQLRDFKYLIKGEPESAQVFNILPVGKCWTVYHPHSGAYYRSKRSHDARLFKTIESAFQAVINIGSDKAVIFKA